MYLNNILDSVNQNQIAREKFKKKLYFYFEILKEIHQLKIL